MAQRPILFSAEMVRAILEGKKTQTRRKTKPQPSTVDDAGRWYRMKSGGESLMNSAYPCPYGKPGDTLFVPETEPRITLRITDVRVQRLQDISEDDARAEGASRTDWEYDDGECCDNDREAFSHLWNRINGPSAWDDNPWVWVIEFERVQP